MVTQQTVSSSLQITTKQQECQPQCEWRDWCDGEKEIPPKPLFTDEYENRNDCAEDDICENPIDIECVTIPDEIPYYRFPGVECNLETGLHCDIKKMFPCPDFKIRYKCCNKTCTTPVPGTTTITPTVTPSRQPTTGTTEITTLPTTPSETTTMTPSETTVTTAESTVTTAETTVTTAQTTEKPCLECEPRPLDARKYNFNGCQTKEPLELYKCAGSCPSSYGYIMNKYGNWEEAEVCSCCRVTAFETKEVELECPGGVTDTHEVKIITGCSCKETTCSP